MSFREKSAWISLVTLIAVFGLYFAHVAAALRAGPVDPHDFLGQYIGSVVLLVILQIVLSIIAAIAARVTGDAAQTARDEREQLIELKANRFALFIVQTGAVLTAGAISLGAPAYVTANCLVLALTLGELVRFGGQIVYYRLGV